RQFPGLFPTEVCSTLSAAEAEGRFHEALQQIAEAVESGDLSSLPVPDRLDTLESQSPARRYVNTVILLAARQGASDIHIEPGSEGQARTRLRIDGVMHPFEPPRDDETVEGASHTDVVSRVKVMAGMDVAERRMPQDGRIELRIAHRDIGPRIDAIARFLPSERTETSLDLRVNVMPTTDGERVAMRILDPRHVEELELENLGMLEDDLETVRRLARMPHGLIVCAGPAGSGKTTVLYAMLREINHEGLTALTIEDPVTYRLGGVTQSEVRPERGLTFARLTRNAFRQDPDIVLVGEVRNLETLQLCAQLALTGHLALTTLHAHSPAQGLRRMLDMGLEPFLINDTVSGLISSRLVRRLCTECRQPIEPPLEELPAEAADYVRALSESDFHRAVGCEECYGTGYRGRTALYEVLVPDESVQRAVARSASVEEIEQAAADARSRTLAQDGLAKAARGTTTVGEVYRVLGHTEGAPGG
ncbi:MAG: GspE/PulE family protein, partial [Candidatus Brocadiia bacterium]